MMWKRAAAGVGLAVMALSLMAVPAATAATGAAEAGPAARSVIVVPPQRVPAIGYFVPQHVHGDADFKGHGPEVATTAQLRITGGGTRLVVVLTMHAKETQSDFTEVNGESPEHLIFAAPIGECIQSTNVGSFDQKHYFDTDHANDVFNGSPASFVSVWNIIGDTSGNEAGSKTGVSIGTQFITVTTGVC